jgi:hypothetical protein
MPGDSGIRARKYASFYHQIVLPTLILFALFITFDDEKVRIFQVLHYNILKHPTYGGDAVCECNESKGTHSHLPHHSPIPPSSRSCSAQA